MPIQLINPNGPFPGCDHEGKKCGWYFEDPHTAMVFDNPLNDLNAQVKEIITHRLGNPHIYPADQPLHFDPDAVRFQVVTQICSRHNFLCEDSAHSTMPQPAPPIAPLPQPNNFPHPNGKTCPQCKGTQFEPIYCASCGGGKLTGFRCKSCGMEVGR